MFCLCQSQQTGSGGLNWTLVCKRPKSSDRKWWAKKMFVRFFLWFQRENSGVTFKTRLLSFALFSLVVQWRHRKHCRAHLASQSNRNYAVTGPVTPSIFPRQTLHPWCQYARKHRVNMVSCLCDFFFFDNVWWINFKINVEWQTQLPTFTFFMSFDGI